MHHRHLVLSSSLLITLGAAAGRAAPTPPEPAGAEAAARGAQLEALRAELQALRDEYAARLAALEARLAAIEATPPPPAVSGELTLPPPAPEPASVPTADTRPPAIGATGAPAMTSKVFNPDIAVVGNFVAGAGRGTDGTPSLEMREAEMSLQAVVDPYARADFFLTFGPDEVGVEEAALSFNSVPGGLLLRAGKLRTAFGKVDGMHVHALPWADRPLVTRNLLGGEEGLADAGVSLARLIPNRWLFLEATAQVYRGAPGSGVFQGATRSDLAWVGHLRAYRDLGESTNLDLGSSIAWGTNGTRPGAHTRLLGADATLRWRPLRRAIYRRALARTELVWSRREQPGGPAEAFGAYLDLHYQFARRWFAGLRLDTSERADDPARRDRGGALVLTWWPSEFSQVRTQYRLTQPAGAPRVHELGAQLVFAIGAHGAHAF